MLGSSRARCPDDGTCGPCDADGLARRQVGTEDRAAHCAHVFQHASGAAPVMKMLVTCLAATFVFLATAPAAARGCLKGALVGGVAGHYAGHPGTAGAVAGCV